MTSAVTRGIQPARRGSSERSPAAVRHADDPPPDRTGPSEAPTPAGAWRGRDRILLLAVAALPMLLIAAGAWFAWREAWRHARSDLAFITDAAAEFGLRVLSAHAVAAGRVDAVLRGLSDDDIRAREAELHQELRALVAELPQAEASFVIDRDGRPLVTANVYPVPRGGAPIAADRDFFLALQAEDAPAIHLSRVYTGRVDGSLFFAVSRRRTRTGNTDRAPEEFDGLVNLSLYPNRLAEGLSRFVAEPGDTLGLVRTDGEVLTRNMGQVSGLKAGPSFLAAAAAGTAFGTYEAVSNIDRAPRLFAIRRVEGWPVYAVASRPRAAIVAAWRQSVREQLLVGGPVSLALLGLVLMVRRGQIRLAAANAELEDRVAQRTAALRESEDRFRSLAEHVPDIVYVQNASSWQLEYLSPAFEAVFGESRDAMLRDARRWEAMLHPEDQARVLAARERLHGQGEAFAAEYRILRPVDGAERFITHRAVPIRDATGRVLRVIGIAHDATDRHRAEAALARSEADLRAIFEGTVVGMTQSDPETGRFLRVNRRFCEMVGYEEAVLTAGMSLRDLIHPDDRAADATAFQAALRGAGRYDLELRCRRRDGTTIWVASQVAILRGADDRPRLSVAAVQDITERRRSEEQRLLMTRELDHRAKNALAVVQAALRLTPKHDAQSYAQAVEGRVAALARAHTLLAEGRWQGAALRAVLQAEMATFLLDEGTPEGQATPRVTMAGPEVMLAPAAVQAISMTMHELATNAIKYGALSIPGGHVAVRWTADPASGLLRLFWEERDGPPVPEAPARRGFGSRVIEATVKDQLGGHLERRWEATGLVCRIDLPLDRVTGHRPDQAA